MKQEIYDHPSYINNNQQGYLYTIVQYTTNMHLIIIVLLCLSAFGELSRFGCAAEVLMCCGRPEVSTFVGENIHENHVRQEGEDGKRE